MENVSKAYIILAHKNPEQVYRLLNTLDDSASHFYVHIDRKVPLQLFNELFYLGDKIQFVKRENGYWGGFGLVQATLNALQSIKESGNIYKQITLLSGQDYPIKSNVFISDYFKAAQHSVFIEYFTIPNYQKWHPNGGLFRVEKYFFGLKFHQQYLAKTLNFLGSYIPFVRRRQPYNLTPYAGSQWWTIDQYALNYILDFIKKHPEYIPFHKRTFAPDELFFHTILLNAKDERLQQSITNNHVRYIHWPDKYKSHPEILSLQQVQEILRSKALFARKFDLNAHQEIFDIIDEQCLS